MGFVSNIGRVPRTIRFWRIQFISLIFWRDVWFSLVVYCWWGLISSFFIFMHKLAREMLVIWRDCLSQKCQSVRACCLSAGSRVALAVHVLQAFDGLEGKKLNATFWILWVYVMVGRKTKSLSLMATTVRRTRFHFCPVGQGVRGEKGWYRYLVCSINVSILQCEWIYSLELFFRHKWLRALW